MIGADGAEPSGALGCAPRTGDELARKGPWDLTVEAIDGTGVRAVLTNASGLPQPIILHDVAQPPEPVVERDGERVPVRDSRDQDSLALTQVQYSAWSTIPPCERRPIGEVRFVKKGNRWHAASGPFSLDVPPGSYDVGIDLRVWFEGYVDPAGRRERVPDVWKGQVTSNRVRLELGT